MSVIINRKIQRNQWSHLADDAPPASASGDVTVSLERWLVEGDSLRRRGGRIGVRLAPGNAVEDIAPFAAELDLIAIEFAGFGEGRGYSHAYLLRERHGFVGELRALGARRDHVAYMERCGIDAFEPAAPETVDDLMAGFDEITVRYQPSSDRVPLIFRRRAGGALETAKEKSA